MRAPEHGNNISAVEISNISANGIWVLVHDKELFMPYDEFPWFKEQTIKSILNVEEPFPGHLYWPDIDIDLTVESIEHPERYPLKARIITSPPAP